MNKMVLTVGSLIPKHLKENIPVLRERVTPAPVIKRIIQHPQKTISLLQKNRRFDVRPEKGKLLDAALSQGQDLQYKCKKGTCGECKVKVEKGMDILSPPNSMEMKKLDDVFLEGYRLACQADIL